jgi:hypothetical protein
MKRDEIPRVLRIKLFDLVRDQIRLTVAPGLFGDFMEMRVAGNWGRVLYSAHMELLELMPDEYDETFDHQIANLKALFAGGRFDEEYCFLEFVLRHPQYPKGFAAQLVTLFDDASASYRIVGSDTFVPYSSDEEVATVRAALADMGTPGLEGVHSHYTAAANELGKSDFAASMRESIHAVESLTKLLTGEPTLQDGVKALAKQGHIHVTVQAALEKIAAWTNGVAGIRHAKAAEAPTPSVDEDDAMFLFGICGTTLSYLKRRGVKLGLIS